VSAVLLSASLAATAYLLFGISSSGSGVGGIIESLVLGILALFTISLVIEFTVLLFIFIFYKNPPKEDNTPENP
jgi:hypothetical protein